MAKRFKILFVIFIISMNCAFAQQADENTKLGSVHDYFNTTIDEKTDEVVLDSIFYRLTTESDPQKQRIINDSIFEYFLRVLSIDDSFAYSFDATSFGRVVSSDAKVCIYSWNYFNVTDKMVFNMIVQTSDGKLFSAKNAKAYSPNILETIDFDDWYGALYYKVEKFRMDKKDFYLLLGWSKLDEQTQLKVAEVMYFENNDIRFGYPMFTTDSRIFHNRLLFRYDWMVQMSLDYNRRKRSIVFDHLSPMESSFPFEEPRYAPDMSFDAYKKKIKYWEYKEDVNMKNK